MAKYRVVFLEEASEHLEDMSRALLELEREPGQGEAIDLVFRMAHSIKGMAASLGYDPITEVAHRLEDRMQGVRTAGRVEDDDLALLWKGFEGIEAMLAAVRDTGEVPPTDRGLAQALASAEAPRKKKVLSPS
jgi:two-component system chemotaxis sensor kinase CheA